MPEKISYQDVEGTYRQIDLDDEGTSGFKNSVQGTFGLLDEIFGQLLMLVLFPVKLLWNIIVVVAAISLTIAWIGFVFGSVIGVVLLIIFMGLDGFLFPMALVALCVPLTGRPKV